MKRQDAIKALDEGKTLTHRYFTSNEWVRGIGGGFYVFEDGVQCTSAEFWAFRNSDAFDSGWSEYV